MKIKLEWDFDTDEWEVRDEQEDRLSHSSRWNGEYVSIDELESLRVKYSKAIALITDVDALIYDEPESETYKRIERFLEEIKDDKVET